MQSSDWITLFKMMPPETHNTLVLMTHTGHELSIETILRTEPAYVVFRGRAVGSTDDGRVFFVPYHQLTYININRSVKEREVREIFGEAPPAAEQTSTSESGILRREQNGSASSMNLPSPILPSTPSALPGASSPGRSFPGVRLPGIVAQAQPPTPAANRQSNVPAAALVPPPSANGNAGSGDTPIPPRNSILERLRAQRNSMIQRVPPQRQ